MIRGFAGRADLGQGIVPAPGQEQHPGHRQMVEAEEERAQTAFGLPQADRVRLPRLGVAVQLEQAVGEDQVRVELAPGWRPQRPGLLAGWPGAVASGTAC